MYKIIAPRNRTAFYLRSSNISLFHKDLCWVLEHPVDVVAMREASKALIGVHDFSSFRMAGCQSSSPFRHIFSIDIISQNNETSYNNSYSIDSKESNNNDVLRNNDDPHNCQELYINNCNNIKGRIGCNSAGILNLQVNWFFNPGHILYSSYAVLIMNTQII